jgi:Fe-S-cluster containining protein
MPTLIQIVDTALASAVARSGPHLACCPGCSQCCHGVFEITATDAARLREGLSLAEPRKAARIRIRLAAARVRLEPFFPGDPVTGLLSDDPDAIERFEEWANADACPILDPTTQTCDLYEHRPILCRTFGPPIRNVHDDLDSGLAICDLCFTEASDQQIAAAEMDSSFRPQEELEDATLVQANPESGPTMIPFAFGPA